MFTAYINPRMTKNQVRDGLLELVQYTGQALSRAKADKLAISSRRGCLTLNFVASSPTKTLPEK